MLSGHYANLQLYMHICGYMHRQGPLFFEQSLSLLVFSFAPAAVFPCRAQVSELDT